MRIINISNNRFKKPRLTYLKVKLSELKVAMDNGFQTESNSFCNNNTALIVEKDINSFLIYSYKNTKKDPHNKRVELEFNSSHQKEIREHLYFNIPSSFKEVTNTIDYLYNNKEIINKYVLTNKMEILKITYYTKGRNKCLLCNIVESKNLLRRVYFNDLFYIGENFFDVVNVKKIISKKPLFNKR